MWYKLLKPQNTNLVTVTIGKGIRMYIQGKKKNVSKLFENLISFMCIV